MRSKIFQEILNKTPKEVEDKVREQANKQIKDNESKSNHRKRTNKNRLNPRK